MANIIILGSDPTLERRVRRLEKKLSDLQTAQQNAEAREAALETRVSAHEQKAAQDLADVKAIALDAQARLGAEDATTVALNNLAAKMDAFDPDATQTAADASAPATDGTTTPPSTG